MDVLRATITMEPRASRSFVTGAADVVPWESSFGADVWQPGDLVSYLTKSNAVQSCVKARTNALTSLPIKLYGKRKDDTGNRKEIGNGPARDLLDTVNPFWTFQRWVEMTEQALCIWGKSFTFYAMRGGRPVEMWWAPADRVKVHPHPTEYVSHFTYDPGRGGKPIRFEREETLWLRYSNIGNQFDGLSPLMSSLLSADSAAAAMKSNYNIFRNGLTAAGMVYPKTDQNLSDDQAKAIAESLNRRFKGVDNAHKVGVLRFPVDIKQLSMTPKDAQFMDLMNFSLEDIARAYAVPIDKIGGRRTYENVEGSERAFWTDCIIPEAKFIAAEITEQLLPLFGGDMVAEFDDGDIDVLHEAETARWEREQGMIQVGRRTINEVRKANGEPPVAWGDVYWMDGARVAIDGPEKPAPQLPPALDPTTEDDPETEPERSRSRRAIEFGSPEHEARWQRQIEVQEPWEERIREATASLFLDQQQSVLATLRKRRVRAAEELLLDPFDRSRWIKAYRIVMRPLVAGVANDAGTLALDELAVDVAFNVKNPRVIELIERQVNRYAEGVNNTTWNQIREAVADGINARESTDQIADRIQRVFAGRREDAEAIARTEVTTAYNTATLEGWKQSGVVTRKRWLAALDGRTRPTHREAHGQEVGIDDNFTVGAGAGPCPGSIGIKAEDVRCRCSMVAVLDVEDMQ